MKTYLIKKNRKTTDVVILESDGTLLRLKEGKLNQTITFSSTENLGTVENLEKYLQEQIAEYQKKGFVISVERPAYIEIKTLDKADWHFNGDFPEELDIYQGYVHTGMFIGWLIENELVTDDFKKEFAPQIDLIKLRKMSPTKFYQDMLDGVFLNEIITPSAINFVEKYFDFKNGQYLTDYENTIGKGFSCLYYVQDTWDNYNEIAEAITKRYSSQ